MPSPSSSPSQPPVPNVCKTCRHWSPIGPDRQKALSGECRRFPPTIVDPSTLTPSGPLVRFGLTLAATTCGEHRKV